MPFDVQSLNVTFNAIRAEMQSQVIPTNPTNCASVGYHSANIAYWIIWMPYKDQGMSINMPFMHFINGTLVNTSNSKYTKYHNQQRAIRVFETKNTGFNAENNHLTGSQFTGCRGCSDPRRMTCAIGLLGGWSLRSVSFLLFGTREDLMRRKQCCDF